MIAAPITSLVGRAAELEGLTGVVRRSRLVTISGPGGVGKTRLAVELARRHVRSSDGVWMVDLASVHEGPGVVEETARALAVQAGDHRAATDALCHFLADRDGLLVLDNCEHILDAVTRLATALLARCAHLRILVTSREPLGIAGESVWTLKPLAPQDASRLFVDRARQRQPEFLPSSETETTIGELCQQLDHLPLAIELAAARLSTMSPAEILADLRDRLGELTGGPRWPARQRSVRAAVDWSYQLLDPTEQAALRALAVFVGGFDARAAMSVGTSIDVLARLVDKSLVAAALDQHRRTRYHLLETVREHVYELLGAAGELEASRRRLFEHFCFVADVTVDGWPSPRSPVLLDELAEDYQNVRAALEWASGADPCKARRLLAGARDLFFTFGQHDGLRLAELLLGRCPNLDRHRVEVQITAGILGLLAADRSTARAGLAEAQRVSAEIGEWALEGWAHFGLGLIDVLGREVDTGRQHLEAARVMHRDLGVGTGEARATATLGLSFVMEGDIAHGRELMELALSLGQAAGDGYGQGQCHTYLGILAESSENSWAAATAHYRQAVELLLPYRDATLLPVALAGQAVVLMQRDPATALQVVASAWAMRTRVGGDFAPFYRTRVERVRTAAEDAVGEEARRLWELGGRLSTEEAISLAFGTARRRTAPADGLTVRERQVARLVVEGLSNKEIAVHLHLSVRTVETHVRHLLTRTGLSNRTQLARWALERLQ